MTAILDDLLFVLLALGTALALPLYLWLAVGAIHELILQLEAGRRHVLQLVLARG